LERMPVILDGSVFVFFQAEDGIRGKLVTGVQTCALPISPPRPAPPPAAGPVPPVRVRPAGQRVRPVQRVRGGGRRVLYWAILLPPLLIVVVRPAAGAAGAIRGRR